MTRSGPGAAALAGIAYWACVLAIGFAFGTLRTLVLEPAIGRLPAVLAELPFILAASWLVARWLVARFAIAGTGPALAMGGLAFVLLMGSELALTSVMPDNSPGQWLAALATPAGFLGLAGQLAFALFPWLIQTRRPADQDSAE